MQFDREWQNVENRGVQLQRVKKQSAKVLEHFGEKVPKETDIWLEVIVVETVN